MRRGHLGARGALRLHAPLPLRPLPQGARDAVRHVHRRGRRTTSACAAPSTSRPGKPNPAPRARSAATAGRWCRGRRSAAWCSRRRATSRTIRASAPAITSSSPPRRPGTRSPTSCRASTPIRPGVDATVLPDPPRSAPPPGTLRGSCLCGAVAYVDRGPPLLARNCHCGRCRKARSAAHAANMFASVDGIHFTRGADNSSITRCPKRSASRRPSAAPAARRCRASTATAAWRSCRWDRWTTTRA